MTSFLEGVCEKTPECTNFSIVDARMCILKEMVQEFCLGPRKYKRNKNQTKRIVKVEVRIK